MKMRPFNDVNGVWHDSVGVPIDKHERDKWGTECAEWLAKEPNEYFVYTRSGDTIVIGIRDSDGNTIEIFDCKIRRDMRFINE
jgi:hypothetical protein